jgi:hypothetical protein
LCARGKFFLQESVGEPFKKSKRTQLDDDRKQSGKHHSDSIPFAPTWIFRQKTQLN